MHEDTDIEALIDAMAQLLGIEIAPDSRPSLHAHLAVAFKMAALVVDFPLGDHAEPAPVFTA